MPSENDSFDRIWFPFTYDADLKRFPPITIERGKGVYLFDTADKRYLDAVGSWWVSILGHNHPQINAAVREQLDKIEHVLLAGFVTPALLRLTGLLGEILPSKLTKVFYSDNGSTSVEVALKIALQYWRLKRKKRKRFISFNGAYHGDTFGAMTVGHMPHYHTMFHGYLKEELASDAPYCYRCPVNKKKDTCNAECMDSMDEILKKQGDTIAACVFEPMVQGSAGMRVYPAKVLTRVFELCRKYGILTIADEVAMGFGRTGRMFACEHANEIPDILCLAKGLTGGYLPMAVTAVSAAVYDEFRGEYPSERVLHHGHSFSGNPLAASAAVATLQIMRAYNLPGGIENTMTYFREQLQRFNALEIVGDIRSIGMVGAIELVAERGTKTRLPVERRIPHTICRRALAKGLLIRPLGDVIYFIPAFIITHDQIDEMFGLAGQSIKEVMNEEFANL
jgi:adenosylmethionine-8-amino-7-oxononanoate aminotransferase